MELAQFKTEVKKISGSDNNQQQLEELIFEYFSHKPISYYEIEPGRFIVRGRHNKNGEVFSKSSQLSYNKNSDEIKLGRVNYAGQQAFYGVVPHQNNNSDSFSTVMMEISRNSIQDLNAKREYFTIGKWQVQNSLRVAVMPFAKSCANRNPDMKAMKQYYDEYLVKMFGQHPANQYFLESLEYISDLLCQYKDRAECYRICAGFYNALLRICNSSHHIIDGLVYPSACNAGAGINIVLKPDAVDSKLYLEWVQMAVMRRHPADPYDLFFGPISDEQIPNSSGDFSFKSIF